MARRRRGGGENQRMKKRGCRSRGRKKEKDKTMADKLKYIPNDDTQNYHFCRLQLVVETRNTQLNEPTIRYTIKVSKVAKPTNKENFIIKLWGQV